jgi:hypothetical protein
MDESGVFLVDIIPPWFPMFIYHLEVNMPVGGRSSETWSHPIDMIIVTIIYTDGKKQSSPAARHGGALGTGRIAPTHSLPRY